ncbi:MAG: hypothetical protein EON59_16210 [Alphaproteobacteria bacterium]|nr:MAG: hypothetical protein EON59_16210 [Alphaproteobacteria bacterium]
MTSSMKIALLGACLLAPAAGLARTDLVGSLLAKATEIYARKGFAPTGWSHRNAMVEGDSKTLAVNLQGGATYVLAGVCDSECEDLDLVVADSNGKTVVEDLLDDDSPIVHVPKSGSYRVKVTMAECAGTCEFGVIAFKN